MSLTSFSDLDRNLRGFLRSVELVVDVVGQVVVGRDIHRLKIFHNISQIFLINKYSNIAEKLYTIESTMSVQYSLVAQLEFFLNFVGSTLSSDAKQNQILQSYV